MPTYDELFRGALRLHAYLVHRHLRGGLLRGPDSGVRWNLRAWRFLKSALDFLPWGDDYAFMQSQGYWVLANWMLYDATQEGRYRDLAMDAAVTVGRLQTPDGYWAYPLPERRHLIATTEGCWGAMALLATYARSQSKELLAGAHRWYEFLIARIGFQEHAQGRAINYFDRPRGKIPNNSALAAWFFARLWKATGDARHLEHLETLLEFIQAAQLPSGELPYIVEGPYERGQEHYLCFQYNSFEFLELARVAKFPAGARARAVLPALARFLASGVTSTGACAVYCPAVGRGGPEVDYYTGVLAAALAESAKMGFFASRELSDRCYSRVLARQFKNGAFAFSTGDYGFLRDTRSYPRQLVMTLFHILLGTVGGDGFGNSGES